MLWVKQHSQPTCTLHDICRMVYLCTDMCRGYKVTCEISSGYVHCFDCVAIDNGSLATAVFAGGGCGTMAVYHRRLIINKFEILNAWAKPTLGPT